VETDVRDAEGVHRATKGCRAVFHVAALYRFWARDPSQFYDVNVGGALNVIEAARDAGVERMVYTSTVGTLGLEAAHRGGAADEHDYPDVSHLFGSYKRSKYVAEHEVLRAGAQGLPVTIVMPTFPLGPRDRAPTPTGRLVLDYLNGRVPGYVDTTLNVVHVDDVAQGHVLALERGGVGRGYILGGENYSLKRLLDVLASCTGLPKAKLRVPRALSLGVAHLSEFVEGRLLRRHPSVPIEAARMSTTHMAFDDTRARKELGYSPRPAAEALESSARWFVDHGYVKASRRARISWGEGTST
jgi:dihydroflavonol-4-reductase